MSTWLQAPVAWIPQAGPEHPALVRAKEHDVDISAIRGTGIGGRVTKDDILVKDGDDDGDRDLYQRAASKHPSIKDRLVWVAQQKIKRAEETAQTKAEDLKSIVKDVAAQHGRQHDHDAEQRNGEVDHGHEAEVAQHRDVGEKQYGGPPRRP